VEAQSLRQRLLAKHTQLAKKMSETSAMKQRKPLHMPSSENRNTQILDET
jgi:hypothetical protein